MIIKSNAFVNYTTIDNEIFRNKGLSARAKGVFCQIASLPPDWTIRKTQLHQFFSEGRDAIVNAFDELVNAGYVVGVEQKDGKGRFKGIDYIVYPTSQLGKPVTENPVTGNPLSGDQALQTKLLQKKQTKETDKGDFEKSLFPDEEVEKEFKHSNVFKTNLFFRALKKESSLGIDVNYYYNALSDWTEMLPKRDKRKKKTEKGWIAQARTFMRKDKEQNKLKMVKTEAEQVEEVSDMSDYFKDKLI